MRWYPKLKMLQWLAWDRNIDIYTHTRMWMYMCIPQLTQWKISRKSGNVHVCCRVWLLATPWSLACQAPLCMRLSRQEYWSGLPFPLPGSLPDPGIKPASPVSPALAGGFFTCWAIRESPFYCALWPHRLSLPTSQLLASTTLLSVSFSFFTEG